MSDRAVTFANIFNVRDLGGHTTVEGRTVARTRLFRADDLSRLGDADIEIFTGLGIRTVIDLRRPAEIEEFGRIPEFAGYSYHHVHLRHPLWPSATFASTDDRAAYVTSRYLEMAEMAAEDFGQALRLIADADTAPLVFHCIAGKDRTGVVSALTLSLLGVSDDDIADDYELSELAEEPNWNWHRRAYPDLHERRWTKITVSPRQGMLAFLDELRARHGSVEAYVLSTGVTPEHIAALRAHLLDPQ